MKSKAMVIKKIKALGFGPLIIENGDYGPNAIALSCEDWVDLPDGGSKMAGDYYGEFRGGYPWIDPGLVKIAKDAGSYWEWMNPGGICLYLD